MNKFNKLKNKIIYFSKRYINKKNNGYSSYTVVSAVYNVEKYIDRFLNSLLWQSLDFKKNIRLILVDDGSNDNTSNIIKKWVKKYPKNIKYIFKENGGQSSARNYGLNYVETAYVSFADPDDFLQRDYFKEIDNFLEKNKSVEISMVSTNIIYYHESNNRYNDTHPLKYKFSAEPKIIKICNINENIQLSAASAIFKTENIKALRFDEMLKPHFEDGKFICKFFVDNISGNIGFVSSAKYFYRKREDKSSTLDKSWLDQRKFSIVLENGYLDILNYAESNLVEIPSFIQNTVLYDISWHVKHLLNNEKNTNFLNDSQISFYHHLLNKILLKIDNKLIIGFNSNFLNFHQKTGLLLSYKGFVPENIISYVESVDYVKKSILIKFYANKDCLYRIVIDGVESVPFASKTRVHNFARKIFCFEHRLWVEIPHGSKTIEFFFEENKSRISFKGKQYTSFPINTIGLFDKIKELSLTKDTWLFIDRDVQADDNAEHLYRYVIKNHYKINAYFALNKSSHDWERLHNEGFNLVDFEGDSLKNIYQKSSKVISSHADAYILKRFGNDTMLDKKFVFLQHGVTQNDLSSWLNVKDIDLFVTVTNPEFESICGDFNNYKFSKKEVSLCGFPRFDELLIKNNNFNKTKTKKILIMPTWRQYLVGNTKRYTNARHKAEGFETSDYFNAWNGLLNSASLMSLCNDNNLKIVFFPHANMQQYISTFQVPNHVDLLTHNDISIQDLFVQCDIIVTDYSSVAFDMAYIGKPIVYYQFDHEEFFSGQHAFTKGYFSYEEDGLGPVCRSEVDLISVLKDLFDSDFKSYSFYKDRVDSIFAYRDSNNCKRVIDRIINLDSSDVVYSVRDALDYVESRYRLSDYKTKKYFLNLLIDRLSVPLDMIKSFYLEFLNDEIVANMVSNFKKNFEINDFKAALSCLDHSLISRIDSSNTLYLICMVSYVESNRLLFKLSYNSILKLKANDLGVSERIKLADIEFNFK